MKFTYPALIHEDSDGIWAEFPDLEGCQTWDDTVDATIEAAVEALELYVTTNLEMGNKLPAPSDMKSFRNLPNNVFATLVQADVDLAKNTKSVKKTLTIPAWLNDKALQMGINFSQSLQEILLQKTMA